MANLHKTRTHRRAHKLWKFCSAYYAVSVVATILFVVYAYKDILSLRFRSEFFSGTYDHSDELGRLPLLGISVAVLIGLTLLTQAGLVFTRMAIRLFKV